ncbi:hypothetical protein QYM36_004613 [Artemia franciscana]|uniref:Uncharacterized protein n=2 Tax=Artemia franciscana TaxID=6661 RepID=A0AA88I3D2_ARTSF|nr:hypothetical protein QYM36_004613 [Artemia franciscana]
MMIEKFGVLDKIKNIKLAAKIIEKYFPDEEEEDENILLNHVAPRVGPQGFIFDTREWESVNYRYEKRHGYPHGYKF